MREAIRNDDEKAIVAKGEGKGTREQRNSTFALFPATPQAVMTAFL